MNPMFDDAEEARLAAAAAWLLRLRDPSVTPKDIAEWVRWCEESTHNRHAFEGMQTLWRRSGAVREASPSRAELQEDRYDGHMSVAEWNEHVSSEPPAPEPLVAPAKNQSRSRWSPAGLALAASVVVAIGAFAMMGVLKTGGGDVAAPIGNRDLALADGSVVTLAPGSFLETKFTSRQRDLFMTGGEAYFKVQKDPGRPFVVHALGATVTAVGTAFNVRAEAGIVRVSVTEGTVRIGRLAEAGDPVSRAPAVNLKLSAGHEMTLARGDGRPQVSAVDASRATSWVGGTLRFVDEPLASVVTAVNRYASSPVRLGDPQLEGLRFTGTVVATRIDEWLRGLPNVFPVVIEQQGDASVVIVQSAPNDASAQPAPR